MLLPSIGRAVSDLDYALAGRKEASLRSKHAYMINGQCAWPSCSNHP